MPIYMDRHEVSSEVTAENVAQLHQEDLKVQDDFNCRGLTYWFDSQRSTAFCLVEAPDAESLHNMHAHAHARVTHTCTHPLSLAYAHTHTHNVWL